MMYYFYGFYILTSRDDELFIAYLIFIAHFNEFTNFYEFTQTE